MNTLIINAVDDINLESQLKNFFEVLKPFSYQIYVLEKYKLLILYQL